MPRVHGQGFSSVKGLPGGNKGWGLEGAGNHVGNYGLGENCSGECPGGDKVWEKLQRLWSGEGVEQKPVLGALPQPERGPRWPWGSCPLLPEPNNLVLPHSWNSTEDAKSCSIEMPVLHKAYWQIYTRMHMYLTCHSDLRQVLGL